MIKTLILITGIVLMSLNVYAVDDIARIEKQSRELEQKQEIIRQETARLQTLKKEVEEDIAKYTELLKQIEKSLEKAQAKGNKRLKHVAKAYEAMQPEDAASRLAGLDDKTAVQILLIMNSKKAGLVIGMMNPAKATILTKRIAKLKK
jgi:flagellar motility protein MotE (MotC chaperone)